MSRTQTKNVMDHRNFLKTKSEYLETKNVTNYIIYFNTDINETGDSIGKRYVITFFKKPKNAETFSDSRTTLAEKTLAL